MASKCRKFVPNMFNKSKCQACFGSKEAHSAAALEGNKATRKVSKCGYLFVSPDFDFSNPLDRSRRWQRRFFRLYDDGELTYSVDDHADTVPQGSVDMNKCTDILDAEVITTHGNSIAVVSPDKTEYFKADSKEEIQWWFDVLVEFPNQRKALKTRRKPNFTISNKENVQPPQDDANQEQLQRGRFEVEKVRQNVGGGGGGSGGGGGGGGGSNSHSTSSSISSSVGSTKATELPAYATFKGVRSLKHKYDKNHQEGMRKSSSLHDLSSQDKDMAASLAASRFLSCSGDRLDVLSSGGGGGKSSRGGGVGGFPVNPYFTIPRTSWPSRVHPSVPLLTSPAAHPSLFNSSSSLSSTSSTNSSSVRRGSLEDRPSARPRGERSRHSRERSTSMKDFPTQLTLPPRDSGSLESVERGRAVSVGGPPLRGGGHPVDAPDDLSQSMSADETDSNETDELKMARSSELSASNRALPLPSAPPNPEASPTKYEDLVYMKKGWLIKQGPSDRESRKHWFVLAGNSLRYYKDAKHEENNNLDGRIDLSTCYEVSEVSTLRNYGFKIKTRNGEYILAAMTSGIRNNWMKAVRLCMDLHSSSPKLGLSTSLTGKALAGLSSRAMDDFEVSAAGMGAGASANTTSTAVVTGSKGETAFQLVGRRDPGKKETRNVRRHHSDVNPGNVSKMFSVVKEFSSNLDSVEPLSSTGAGSSSAGDSQVSSTSLPDHHLEAEKSTPSDAASPRASKIPRHHSPSSAESTLMWSQTGSSGGGGGGSSSSSGISSGSTAPPMKRYVEGSDGLVAAQALQSSESNRRSKRSSVATAGDGVGVGAGRKEEDKREMMRRAKSPSARVKEKSRGAKTPRLHSPPPGDEEFEDYRGSGGSGGTSRFSDTEDDMDMTLSSEDHYHSNGAGVDDPDGGQSDSIGEGSMMVEILESEVESLKERLDHTQSQLVKMHETNIDLKTRLQKESSQNLDTSYGGGHGRTWSQPSMQQLDPSQVQTMKRQLKEAKDTVQKQRLEIEALKSKLDMSVSKLTGTEKALSEALKEYKQEKDKFLKLSAEWNRRIRTLEGQVKESGHKVERSNEALLAKEREARRLETEIRQHQQKSREHEREILKLKAVENEYNQLKECLDTKDQELCKAHTQLNQKTSSLEQLKHDYEHQLGDMEREFSHERDDLENHLEELKNQLCSAQERQSSMADNMTSNIADLLGEKDETIAQLEEKLIEHDRKMVDMQEELQAEMSENSDLMANLETLQDEKQQLHHQIEAVEKQVLSLKDKVGGLEKDNSVLRHHLDKMEQENTKLSTRLRKSPTSSTSSTADTEKEVLEKTILDLNKQIQGLQLKLMERFEDLEQGSSKSTGSDHDDLLHNIIILDSDLKEINALLMQLHGRFDAYVSTLSGNSKKEASTLAEMVDEIGHRCVMLQETLQEGSPGLAASTAGSGGDYQHSVTVTTSSGSAVIFGEYRDLKGKFDRVVAELKKLKKEVNQVYSSYGELEKKDKQLVDRLDSIEGSYQHQVEDLVQRVDQLSTDLASKTSTTALQTRLATAQPAQPSQCVEVDQQLSQLDAKINILEKALGEVGHNPHPSPSSASPSSPCPQSQDTQKMVGRLKEMRQQLEKSTKDLKDIVKDYPSSSQPQQALVSRMDGCGRKLDKMVSGLAQAGSDSGRDSPGHGAHSGTIEITESSASSMARCMQEIMDRIQEVGEQLDCLEDEAEDSDDEEEEATTVEDVRERLASLCEYVKQHSKFSDYDWRLLQLLAAQKSAVSKDRLEAASAECSGGSGSDKDKLQAYADRLSLESLILVEMSHLLERRESDDAEGERRDPVMREISVLNSKILSLHQKLDTELRTLCVTGASADVLQMQADIMAEKILSEGQLCSDLFAQGCHLSAEEAQGEEEKKVQPKLLAAEALMRSQLDSYIGQNLDKTCDELWSSASHVTTRSLAQGELTFALARLKNQLSDGVTPAVEGQSVGGQMRDLWFERLKQRHEAMAKVAGIYQDKMIQALAVIISKESEEMTIVEGPENVLEAVCSEVSTIMEKHIQLYKEKVRGAKDTHSAHRWDMMVNQLRADREVVMTALRQQHATYAADPDSEAASSVEVPFQSLDSSINNFGEIASLCSMLYAQMAFITEVFKMGDQKTVASLLADMEAEEEEDEEEEEEGGVLKEGEVDDEHRALQKGLSTFVHNLAEALQAEARSRQSQVNTMLTDNASLAAQAADIPTIPSLTSNATVYSATLAREAVFAAQTTFTLYKMKLLHEQEMDALRVARPARSKPNKNTEGDDPDPESDIYQVLFPLEEVLDTKYDDEMETLRVIASQVGKLEGVVRGRDWPQVEEHVRQLEQKVQDELNLAQQRHEVHLDLFKQEESKVENAWEESQTERDHFEERCKALETELRSMSNQHDDEVERMRQDVMTAVSAIRANEEESETQLSDKVQVLTKQMLLQKEKYKRFLSKMKSQLSDKENHNEGLVELLNKEMKDIIDSPQLPEDEELPPLPSQPPPDAPRTEEKTLNMEEELELLKKEKDEALAEETRNTKAALDAMRKAYEEELQHERLKYRECLTTMYNEDFVSEIRRRHEVELEKTQEELKQVRMHYFSKCEDLKLLEVKLGQTKQDYESHINQLIMSNDHLDDMVNQEIERLKDFIKNRPANLTTGSATMEEELYDAQIMIRVKDAELQKLRSQVKNFENSLHRTTEEHRQTMTQYLQALKENQEARKEYQAETNTLREQLDKALHESGLRRPIRRTPSFHQRARSPSPIVGAPQRRDSTSATTDHVSRDSNRRRRIDPKDLRRSKSSPSLPYIFDAKGIASAMKSPGKMDRRQSQKQ